MQKLYAVPSEAAGNHRSLQNDPSAELRRQPPGLARSPAAEPLTHRRISGAAPGGADPFPPAFHAHTAAPSAYQGFRGDAPSASGLDTGFSHAATRSSARAGTQPGLLPQPWTCGAVGSSDARAGPSHPAPLAQSASWRLHPGHAHPTPPASAPCPWLRPPGCCKTQMPEAGSRPGELAVPAEDRQDLVARRVFLGKPLLRHSFILRKASGCSLK